MNQTNKTKFLILSALFAALTAVFSQLSIPLPFTPVPVNLATLSVLLSGALLGLRYGLLSQLIYILLGLFGLPVFAQFTAGPGILLGPTGGYIIGYALAAATVGALMGKAPGIKKSHTAYVASTFAAGTLLCYAVGTLWFMMVTGTGLLPSLTMCVFPFLPGDALKILAGCLLVKRLRLALY